MARSTYNREKEREYHNAHISILMEALNSPFLYPGYIETILDSISGNDIQQEAF